MGKARSDTYDKIKELIPQFLAAGKIKTKNEYRYYKVEKDKTMEGDYHAIYLLTAKEEAISAPLKSYRYFTAGGGKGRLPSCCCRT